MGQSSRSSSTLKKTFQTFKSFIPIQRTTSITRMKYAFAILVIACAVAAASADGEVDDLALPDDVDVAPEIKEPGADGEKEPEVPVTHEELKNEMTETEGEAVKAEEEADALPDISDEEEEKEEK